MVGDHPDDPAPVPASASPDGAAPVGDGALELGYTVTVDNFSGPLDLLLYLVRRTELDILEVPLALIVDQFVDTVRSWQDADLDVAGEFILMAATLLELKARTIAPPLEQPVEGAEDEPMFDPRESLLKSLLAYRRFKEASQVITGLEEARWPLVDRQFREHVPEAPPEDTDIDLGEIDLALLATTCERILSRIGGLGPRTVVVDEMPLGVRIATLLDELTARERATINELLSGNTSRVVHITTVMATLELARQRFIEVQQPEQFGDIDLRLRSAEERERAPELPPPEPEGPKRRRKLPLVTWHAPAGAVEQASDEATDEAPEEVVESDEQRFLRELEEATRVTAVLALTADVEKSFTEHWYTLHPELKPAPPPIVQPEAVPAPMVRRAPPRRRAPAEPAPATETPAPTAAAVTETPVGVLPADVAAAAQPAPAETVAVTTDAAPAVAAAVVGEPAVPVAAVAVTPPAAEPPTAAEVASASPAEVSSSAVVAAAPPLAPAETAPPVAAPSAEDPSAAIAAAGPSTPAPPEASVPAPTPPVTTDQPAAVVAPAEPVAQAVLPVEQWPVLHAQPAPEEVPHPLDTIASDDPAAVNALLGEQPRPLPLAAGVEEDDDEDEDPDDLLADDPALVNAALQADQPRPAVGRRPASDVIIPPPTETTVWTAPVDRGQTAAGAEDDGAVGGGQPEAVGEQPAPGGRQPVAVGEPTPSTEPLHLATGEAAVPPADAADDELEPDDEEPLADPALVEASRHADAPRSVGLHPVHDLTIPTATETTVWTAPVDRGQTAAAVDDDLEPAAESGVAESVGSVVEGDGDHIADEVVAVAPAAVEPLIVASSTAAAEPSAVPALVMPAGDPTPTTAPLVLADPVPAVPEPLAPVAEEPASSPAAIVRVTDPPPPDDPPPLAPPPPASRRDSPNPAPTTLPTKTSPMSPPPRSKLWPLIAIFLAINAVWAGVLWSTWLPRAVLEVATTERGGTPEQETLTWRFNLDVVDAEAQAEPPQVVPVITPAIPGRWHWADARTLVFDAAGRLPLATSFTATLPVEGFRTVHGFRLRASAQQTWSTAALSVNDAAVETFTRDGTTVALTFNQPVDPLAIAQELSVELAPVAEPAPAPTPVADSAPVADDQRPATVSQEPAADSQQPVASAGEQSAGSSQSPAPGARPALASAPALAAEAAPSAPAVQVRAITGEASSTIRLLIATPVRGTARLRLPAGTTGVAGPLGLAQGWEHQVALRQTLALDSAITEVPSHGAIRIDVAVSDPLAPRELLAPVVTVEPPVPVTVSTTDAGLSLTGAFVPGETYRIRSAATWPDEPSTSGHVLAAYTAASEIAVTIPTRPAGIWPGDGGIVDGRTRYAAHAVERADVLLVTGEDECVASRELVWSGSEASPSLDLDDLTEAQPAANYRLRVRSQGESPVTSEQALYIDEVRVRPQALVAALSDWLLAGLAGEEQADVRVRVVRLADR